jgi:hypothetical protein
VAVEVGGGSRSGHGVAPATTWRSVETGSVVAASVVAKSPPSCGTVGVTALRPSDSSSATRETTSEMLISKSHRQLPSLT